MDNPVSMRRDGNVAIITIDNPPVNALRHGVRKGILENVIAARDDASVEAIILTGAGRTFVAGADITEFGKPPQPPSLIDVIAVLDDVKKPTIAAVHGTPLGGGLELTMGCHFRVAAAGTRLGLPEIKLGLIPGAGGTQRLPRLVGIEKALPMILSGDPIPAKDALAAGLVDEIIEGDLVQGAVAFARKVLAEKRPLARVKDRDEKLQGIRANPAKFDEIVAQHAKKTRGLHAPAAAIEAIRMTLDTPIDEAQKKERDLFMKLVVGDQSKAQRHIFFAEREAAKVPGIGKDVAPREIKTRRGDRRRHHGRRHLDELRQCGHPGDDHRERRGRAQARHGDDREELSDVGAARLADAGEHGEAPRAVHAEHRPQRVEGRRHRDRSGVREHAGEEGAVRQDREDRQKGRGAGDQHLLSRRERDRAGDEPRAGRARHALLLARERDEAAGDRARQGYGAGRARDRDGGRAQDQQGAGRGRRLPWVCRQPHAFGARDRGREAACSKARCRRTWTAR